MWPFAPKRLRLDELARPTPIDVVATVASGNDVASPISGLRAAFVWIEALERLPAAPHDTSADGGKMRDDYVSLGAIAIGDVVTLELEGAGAAVDLVVRRAKLRLLDDRAGVVPVGTALPELVPLFARARTGGVLCQREHLVLHGDRLRLQAIVERTSRVATSGYRSSEPVQRLLVRDDLAPVLLDEVLEPPPF